MSMLVRRVPLALVLLSALHLPAARALTPGQACEKAATDRLRTCVAAVGKRTLACYRDTGATCTPGDAAIATSLATVAAMAMLKCPDTATVTAAGYSAALTPAGLIARLQEACKSAIASLEARSFGGPHAAVRSTNPSDRSCLDFAFTKGRKHIESALRTQSRCLLNEHRGRPCDATRVNARLASREAASTTSISRKCPSLQELVAVDAATFTARASAQARCLVATAHGATAPLTLDCGPRASVPVPPRATNTQVVLNSTEWGTRCGDGSDYAFRLRLAPTGSPVEKVVVYMQGGGVCYDAATCGSRGSDYFEALSDGMVSGGAMSSTASTNPFRDWTKVYLPYCTQDLHIGGGATSVYGAQTVERFGALNTRASLRYLRDVVWSIMDASDPDGFRPDRMTVLLTGGSAGGYGAAYNYHYALDDLRWVHTTAAPDSGLGMDNGTVAGVIGLGAVIALPDPPAGWGVRPYLPPYCFSAECTEIFTNLLVATQPRLKGTQEQQVLTITNQIDSVQVGTTFFSSTAAWVNTLRASYCAIQGMVGLHSFLGAQSTSIHGMVAGGEFNTVAADGTLLRDWLGGAFADPDGVTDRVESGTLGVDYPGVNPFPCTVD